MLHTNYEDLCNEEINGIARAIKESELTFENELKRRKAEEMELLKQKEKMKEEMQKQRQKIIEEEQKAIEDRQKKEEQKKEKEEQLAQ